MSNEVRNRVWAEKYKPKTIDDVIIPQMWKDKFNSFIAEKNCENMLLTGPPGNGKCVSYDTELEIFGSDGDIEDIEKFLKESTCE